jgi:gliding motility-associated-like protein
MLIVVTACKKGQFPDDQTSWSVKDTAIVISDMGYILPNQMAKIIVSDTFKSYLWSTGATKNYINTNMPGTYTCICKGYSMNADTFQFMLSPSEYLYPVPTVFTPNGDGINDIWRVKFSSYLKHIEIKIFDLNNNLLYQYNAQNFYWNGNDLNGKNVVTGRYYYYIKLDSTDKNSPVYTGYVLLMR